MGGEAHTCGRWEDGEKIREDEANKSGRWEDRLNKSEKWEC